MSGISKAEKQRRQEELERSIREKAEKEIRSEYDAKIAYLEERLTELCGADTGISRSTLVPVISNVSEPLIYVSKRTAGYAVEWEHRGCTEYMDIGELSAMRSSDRRFFTDNWIILGDTDKYSAREIYEQLKVSRYYPEDAPNDE